MRIEVVGEASIGRQARTYAEYRLFAALSQMLDTELVRHVRVVLRRASHRSAGDDDSCTVTVYRDGACQLRVRAVGDHLYAAINHAADAFSNSSATPHADDQASGVQAAAE